MLPPGPKIPSFLQRLLLLIQPLDTIEQWAKEYGDTFRLLSDEMPPVINFSSPEAIKTIFNAPSDQISSVQKSQSIKTLIGDNSIIFLDNVAHRRERKLIMPIFHKERMVEYGELIIAITKQVMNQFREGETREKYYGNAKTSLPFIFLLRPCVKEITLRVIVNVVFGCADSQKKSHLQKLLTSLVNIFDNPLFSLALIVPFFQQEWGGVWKDYKDVQKEIDEVIQKEIAQRRQNPTLEKSDILGLLMAARDENDGGLTNEALRDEIMTLIFAGFETTAAALSWAIYWVHYLPEVETRLRNEISAAADLHPSTSSKLPYLNAVVSESLRIYPVALSAFSRSVVKPIEIEGYTLPAGTTLTIGIYQAHKRKSVYPDPEQFKPERFLERSFSPYEFLPFGGGDPEGFSPLASAPLFGFCFSPV